MPALLESEPQQSERSAPRSCIAILGVPFDCVSMQDTVELIQGMIQSRRAHYLATANVDFTVQALEDEELRRILFDAHLVVCDGTPLIWASKWLGNRLPERVAGSDLVPLLIRVAAECGYRIYFLGGRPDVTERAVANLTREYPTLQIVGCDSPPFAPLHEMDHVGIGARIRAARPDLLFVSFGCPKQEKWIAMNYRTLGVPVSIGVGATIDFLAGEVSRAPVWMQRTGLEWVFRLLQEPRRLFQRYVKDFWVFGRGIVRQWWQLRPISKAAGVESPINPPEAGRLALPAQLDAAFAEKNGAAWDALCLGHDFLLVDASAVEFVDSTGVGALIRLHRRLRSHHGGVIIVAASRALLRALDLMKLTSLFPSAPDEESARRLSEQLAQEAKMPVRRSRTNTSVQLAWEGEITAASLDQVWDQTAVKLDTLRDDEEEVVIDLSGVRFLDSSGLGLMVRSRRFARQQGKRLRFIDPREGVLRVIRMARLQEFLLEDAS